MIEVPVYRTSYLNIFGFELKFAIFFLMGLLAFLVFSYFFLSETKRKKLDKKETILVVIAGYIGGMIGARFFFYFMPWWTYDKDWTITERIIKFFSFFDAGLVFYGGVVGGIIALWIYYKIKGIKVWKYYDSAAPAVIIGIAIARVGCFIVDDTCRGINSNLPWAVSRVKDGVELHGGAIHPAPLYISMYLIAIFIALWAYRKKSRFDGEVFLIAMIADSSCRFFVEFVRYYPVKLFGWVTPSQVVSVVIVSVCLILYFKMSKKGKKKRIKKK